MECFYKNLSGLSCVMSIKLLLLLYILIRSKLHIHRRCQSATLFTTPE
jgi:hypothetical protein